MYLSHAKKHKYIDKIKINGRWRYFYTHEELAAFMRDHRINKEDGRVYQVTQDADGSSTWKTIGYTSVNDTSIKGKIQNAKNFINGLKKRFEPSAEDYKRLDKHIEKGEKIVDKYIADPFRPYPEKKYKNKSVRR